MIGRMHDSKPDLAAREVVSAWIVLAVVFAGLVVWSQVTTSLRDWHQGSVANSPESGSPFAVEHGLESESAGPEPRYTLRAHD